MTFLSFLGTIVVVILEMIVLFALGSNLFVALFQGGLLRNGSVYQIFLHTLPVILIVAIFIVTLRGIYLNFVRERRQ